MSYKAVTVKALEAREKFFFPAELDSEKIAKALRGYIPIHGNPAIFTYTFNDDFPYKDAVIEGTVPDVPLSITKANYSVISIETDQGEKRLMAIFPATISFEAFRTIFVTILSEGEILIFPKVVKVRDGYIDEDGDFSIKRNYLVTYDSKTPNLEDKELFLQTFQ